MANTSVSSLSPYVKDLTGQRFGRLIVMSLSHTNEMGHAFWNCVCDCTKPRVVRSSSLVRGSCRSCGCLASETSRARLKTHGKTGTPEHNIWLGIIARTENPNASNYPRYGGAKPPIKMCKRWLNSFENFFEDLGPRPSPAHSIERKNNLLGYFPENCIWALPADQARNRKNNRYIEFRGDRFLIPDWAKKTGIPLNVLWYRYRAKWPAEKMLTTPAHKYTKNPTTLK